MMRKVPGMAGKGYHVLIRYIIGAILADVGKTGRVHEHRRSWRCKGMRNSVETVDKLQGTDYNKDVRITRNFIGKAGNGAPTRFRTGSVPA